MLHKPRKGKVQQCILLHISQLRKLGEKKWERDTRRTRKMFSVKHKSMKSPMPNTFLNIKIYKNQQEKPATFLL